MSERPPGSQRRGPFPAIRYMRNTMIGRKGTSRTPDMAVACRPLGVHCPVCGAGVPLGRPQRTMTARFIATMQAGGHLTADSVRWWLVAFAGHLPPYSPLHGLDLGSRHRPVQRCPGRCETSQSASRTTTTSTTDESAVALLVAVGSGDDLCEQGAHDGRGAERRKSRSKTSGRVSDPERVVRR
jgi:hypothetical protein